MTVKILSLLLVGAIVFTVRGNDEATMLAAEVVVEESTAGQQQQQQSPIVEAIMEQHQHPSVDEASATTTASETYSPTEAVECAAAEDEQQEAEEDALRRIRSAVELIAFNFGKITELHRPEDFLSAAIISDPAKISYTVIPGSFYKSTLGRSMLQDILRSGRPTSDEQTSTVETPEKHE